LSRHFISEWHVNLVIVLLSILTVLQLLSLVVLTIPQEHIRLFKKGHQVFGDQEDGLASLPPSKSVFFFEKRSFSQENNE